MFLAIAAFVLVAGASALWFRRVFQVRIPEDRRGFVAAWAGGAGLGVAALAEGVGLVPGILAGAAALSGVALLGLLAVSGQRTGPDALRVGDPLPDFSAVDADGEPFESASLAGRPVLLKLFRGHW